MSEVANCSRREVEDELKEIFEAQAAGVSYIFGHCYMEATRSSSWLKKFAINWAFNFLKRNCLAPTKALNIPHNSLIEVGMIYHV
jgi:KUP system potassium uptake protein